MRSLAEYPIKCSGKDILLDTDKSTIAGESIVYLAIVQIYKHIAEKSTLKIVCPIPLRE